MSQLLQRCAFDKKCDLFVTFSHDNRIRVFDVQTGDFKHQLFEKNHLNKTYTAFDIFVPQKEIFTRNHTALLVTGSKTGAILFWDLKLGTYLQQLQRDYEVSYVSAIEFSSDGKHLYFSTGSLVYQYDYQSKSTNTSIRASFQIKKFSVHPQEKFIAVVGQNNTIEVISVEDRQVVCTLETGYTEKVRGVKFSHCGQYLFVHAQRARNIMIFDWENQSQIAVLVAKHPVYKVISQTNNVPGGKEIDFVTWNDAGFAEIFRFTVRFKNHGSVSVSNCCEIRAPSSNANAGIQSIEFVDKGIIMVAYGLTINPLFQKVQYATGKNLQIIKPHFTLSGSSRIQYQQELVADDHLQKKRLANTYLAGPVELAHGSLLHDGSLSFKKQKLSPNENELITTIPEAQISERAKAIYSGFGSMTKKKLAELSVLRKEASSVPKVVSLLMESLTSSDDLGFERYLSLVESNMIQAVFEAIPSDQLIPFIEKICIKLNENPSKYPILLPWVRIALTNYTYELVQLPWLKEFLPLFKELATESSEIFTKFARVKGRFKLITSQLNGQSNQSKPKANNDQTTGDDEEEDENLNNKGTNAEGDDSERSDQDNGDYDEEEKDDSSENDVDDEEDNDNEEDNEDNDNVYDGEYTGNYDNDDDDVDENDNFKLKAKNANDEEFQNISDDDDGEDDDDDENDDGDSDDMNEA